LRHGRLGVPDLENPATGQTITFLERTSERLVVETTYRAGGADAPAHYHPSQEEHFEVLEGAVLCSIEGEKRTLRAGETLDVPAGTIHRFGGHPDEDARVRWETRPALRTAEFFEEIFPLGKPSLLEAAAVIPRYDAEFRLASPPRPLQKVLFGVLGPVSRLTR
jgi:quercetin dioxygenase-like cupin family protein